jgi:hypothetical protein
MAYVRRRVVGNGAGLATVVAGLSVMGLVAATSLMAGCGSTPPVPTTTPDVDTKPADRDQLAGLAAAAKDRRYVATYTLAAPDRPDRTVTVAFATDGTWVVAVPGGALSGLADIAIYRGPTGLFQCVLGPAIGTQGSRPDLGPMTPSCAPLPELTAAVDPVVQHVFTDWIDPLVDRATALSVARTDPLPNSEGVCYSVESNSAALAPPLDPGVYCFAADGMLTAVRASFGTLVLAGPIGAAPPSVAMPAPPVDRAPVPMTAPAPPPPPSPTATPAA